MEGQPAKTAFDVDRYERRVRDGPCFVCALVAGHPDYRHHVVYEDDTVIAFLARDPTLLGYCLVAPRQHIESWVRDVPQEDFLRFQGIVYAVATALAATLPTERMYSLSLGSQQGNAHLHWHLAPLPPGVPYHQQQFHALMAENGILEIDDKAQAALARDIRRHLSA
ncbi:MULTISPECIES: HIT domain-containing protein [unclassified Micromonospora]|uniref:HIT family protein n=1 Tax=unclassified Micromonospora TaxID=2617518 RepID=UPI0033AF9BE6